MKVSKLFRKINNYVKRSFFVVLMYSVIYFILNSLILTFDNNNLSSVTYERDLYIFLFLTLISNLIYRYFQRDRIRQIKRRWNYYISTSFLYRYSSETVEIVIPGLHIGYT